MNLTENDFSTLNEVSWNRFEFCKISFAISVNTERVSLLDFCRVDIDNFLNEHLSSPTQNDLKRTEDAFPLL